MIRQHVSSSNINSVGFHEDEEILEIEFNNGSVYQYFDVPKHVFDDLVNAESPGGYFARNIKGIFRFSRV
ncbi:KTSC domain-containing protein [Rahnella aceris]